MTIKKIKSTIKKTKKKIGKTKKAVSVAKKRNSNKVVKKIKKAAGSLKIKAEGLKKIRKNSKVNSREIKNKDISKEKEWKKREKKKTILILILIIILAALLFFLCFLSTPVNGTIKVGKSNKIEREKKCNPTKYFSEQFSFGYLDCYEIKIDEDDSKNGLKKVFLIKNEGVNNKVIENRIVIKFSNESVEDISEVPSVMIRRKSGSGYEENPILIADRLGVVFEKESYYYEKTAFFYTKDKKLTSISFHSNYKKQLDEEFELLKRTFEWL